MGTESAISSLAEQAPSSDGREKTRVCSERKRRYQFTTTTPNWGALLPRFLSQCQAIKIVAGLFVFVLSLKALSAIGTLISSFVVVFVVFISGFQTQG